MHQILQKKFDSVNLLTRVFFHQVDDKIVLFYVLNTLPEIVVTSISYSILYLHVVSLPFYGPRHLFFSLIFNPIQDCQLTSPEKLTITLFKESFNLHHQLYSVLDTVVISGEDVCCVQCLALWLFCLCLVFCGPSC